MSRDASLDMTHLKIWWEFAKLLQYISYVKGYLRYKTMSSQNVSSEAQIKNFFCFMEKLCSFLKIFKFLYF